eukprot:scaffold105386_cov38-Prasinocladus_malaysianus.AAC.1
MQSLGKSELHVKLAIGFDYNGYHGIWGGGLSLFLLWPHQTPRLCTAFRLQKSGLVCLRLREGHSKLKQLAKSRGEVSKEFVLRQEEQQAKMSAIKNQSQGKRSLL